MWQAPRLEPGAPPRSKVGAGELASPAPPNPGQSTGKRSHNMNWDTVKGDWPQFKGKVKEKWGKLTDDDLTVVAGRRDQLLGRLQERYGHGKHQAARELDDVSRRLAP